MLGRIKGWQVGAKHCCGGWGRRGKDDTKKYIGPVVYMDDFWSSVTRYLGALPSEYLGLHRGDVLSDI